jgi:hypothetical protein
LSRHANSIWAVAPKYAVKDISHVLYGLAYFDDADKDAD